MEAVVLTDRGEIEDQYRCQTCSKTFQNIDSLYTHQNELGHMELKQTPRGPGYLCWKKGCNQYFKSAQMLQIHFREIHSHRQQVAVSERHVYKYRCNQCSLAFKTLEKLQQHSQYHMIRAATKCFLCERNFRSIDAMRKHVETSHLETMTDTEKEQYKANLAATASLGLLGMDALSPSLMDSRISSEEKAIKTEEEDEEMETEEANNGEDGDGSYKESQFLEDYMNSQSIAEDSYNDPSRKYKCHRCKVAFTKQNYLTAHNKTLLHRKGDKMTYPMEKYLDPNRPFKCDVCKESFTQKNILLVHYNSVSHLHKLKQGSSTSPVSTTSTTSPENNNTAKNGDDKPYKCNICNVAYSQTSNLEIHMRSVLHQSRTAKVQELAATGQIDLTKPAIESPDNKTSQHKKILADMLQQKQMSSPIVISPISTSMNTASSLGMSLNLSLPSVCTPTFTTTTTPLSTPKPETQVKDEAEKSDNNSLTCDKCGSLFASQEAMVQHQQMFCIGMLGHYSRNMRFKPQVQRNLLENFGFDCVMQFNEYQQRLPKKEAEEGTEKAKENESSCTGENDKDEQKKDENENNKEESTSETRNGEILKDKSAEDSNDDDKNMPEINKCKCSTCGKQFSSVWVLKAHQEEVHKEIVPVNFVEELGEAFRENYEKKQPKTPAPVVIEPISTPKDRGTPETKENAMPTVSTPSQLDLAALQTAQMMQMPMFNAMLPMPLGMPMAMNMAPPLMPMMMPMGGVGADGNFSHMPMMDPNLLAAQKQQQLAAAQNKRARTRINDEQLKILRAHFDINNSPSEEQIMAMSDKSGLPPKVIKHWFRNTLFKERQRNKDSPYNFNNPPSTTLNLEEYEKTGKITEFPDEKEGRPKIDKLPEEKLKPESARVASPAVAAPPVQIPASRVDEKDSGDNDSVLSFCESNVSSACSTPAPLTPAGMRGIAPSASHSELVSALNSAFPHLDMRAHQEAMAAGLTSSGGPGMPKRANRTRFTDYQLKLLQDYFETNAYPKDDDLDHLSKLLNLSPRVIVVWFQNARQKARKNYENQPPAEIAPSDNKRFQRTPGLNYQCNKCMTVFQRYYELIKHQTTQCGKGDGEKSGKDDSDSLTDYSNSDNKSPDEKPKSESRSPATPRKNSDNHFQCEKCHLSFPRFDLWKEHQNVHNLNPNLFPNFAPDSAFAMLQNVAQQKQQLNASSASSILMSPNSSLDSSSGKRRLEEEEDCDDQPRDKRLRTTILPEQLDYLYQKYQVDCNPSRKQLETISAEVGLKKRVVQVWFQNTRARERKGQYRAHQQLIYKRCPFCRALFRAKSALESHLATKHPEEMAKGEVNVDNLPDASQDSPSNNNDSKLPGANNALDMAKLLNNPYNIPNPFMPGMPAEGLTLPGSNEPLQNNMKRLYEDSLKKYLDELSGASHLANKATKEVLANSVSPGATKAHGEDDTPLDLSKPLKIAHPTDASFDDSRSDSFSESTENNDEGLMESPCSPNSSTSSNPRHSTPHKRYRTQMTNLQIKVMKSIFTDYKTPTMAECEMLGREIGLQKRVVQVWFQNARAKEKKQKSSFSKFGEVDFTQTPEECKICNFKYSHKYTIQDHIFTRKHIDAVKNQIHSSGEVDRDYTSPAAMSQILSRPEASEKSKSWQVPPADPSLVAHPHLAQLHAMGLQALSQGGKGEAKEKEAKSSTKTSEESKTTSGNKKEGGALSFGNFPMPGAEMSAGMFPYLYPGIGGFIPGMGLPLMQPGMFPPMQSPDNMFMYDPSTFGTPLTLLQIPQEAIQKVQNTVQNTKENNTQYTQDCKTLKDAEEAVSSTDAQLLKATYVDVGYICRKCHMVYPGKEACENHQQSLCYRGKPSDEMKEGLLKLEQMQYKCSACKECLSTVKEFKSHCDGSAHKEKCAEEKNA